MRTLSTPTPNTSMGPMSVVIPPTVAAFQTHNCKLWMRIS